MDAIFVLFPAFRCCHEAALKLRPYGAIQICLLLLLCDYEYQSMHGCRVASTRGCTVAYPLENVSRKANAGVELYNCIGFYLGVSALCLVRPCACQ